MKYILMRVDLIPNLEPNHSQTPKIFCSKVACSFDIKLLIMVHFFAEMFLAFCGANLRF